MLGSGAGAVKGEKTPRRRCSEWGESKTAPLRGEAESSGLSGGWSTLPPAPV